MYAISLKDNLNRFIKGLTKGMLASVQHDEPLTLSKNCPMGFRPCQIHIIPQVTTAYEKR